MPRIISNESEYVRDLQEISNPIEADILTNAADISTNTANILATTSTANNALAKTGGIMTGAIFCKFGTNAQTLPELAWSNDTNTGLYWISADRFGTTNGGAITFSFGPENKSYKTLAPGSSNGFSLGSLDLKWIDVWAVDGSINTSDERLKRNITDSTLGLSFIKLLKPKTYIWRDELIEDVDGLVESYVKTHSRPHLGLIAQDVRAAIEASGESLNTTDIVSNEFLIDPTAKDQYSIRYHTLIGPLINAVKELSAEVSALKTRIELLESG
jgi:hypothetical protein